MLDVPKLCRALYIQKRDLDFLVNNIDRFYYLKSNPKLDKSGNQLYDKHGRARTRDLYPSVELLKVVQSRIHKIILKRIKLPNYAFGGIESRDNVLNAKMHQGNKYFFNTDLRNFYPSVGHKQIFEMFLKNGFAPATASILTKLTTYRGQLPQGTPTSPYLANLAFVDAGLEIEAFANKFGLIFTTFVDDITLSGKTDFKEHLPTVLSIIASHGFKISHNKTFYQTRNPNVTGVILKPNGLCLSRKYMEKIDALEDKETPQAIGMINYYRRVAKISKIKTSQVKRRFK